VTTQHGSFLAIRRGGLTPLLLCAVQFLDVTIPRSWTSPGRRSAATWVSRSRTCS